VGDPLSVFLLLFGVGFLAANLILLYDYLSYRRRRPRAVLTWRPERTRTTYALSKYIAVGLGLVMLYKLFVLRWLLGQVFGELMMFVYYGAVYPMSLRIERGLYEDGVWLERGFVKYGDITGLTWRDLPEPTLVVVAGNQQRAGRLVVPSGHTGAVRRKLRDRIGEHVLHPRRPVLDLGGHDERDDV